MIEDQSRALAPSTAGIDRPCCAAIELIVSPSATVYDAAAGGGGAVGATAAERPPGAATDPGRMIDDASRPLMARTSVVRSPWRAAIAETVSPACTSYVSGASVRGSERRRATACAPRRSIHQAPRESGAPLRRPSGWVRRRVRGRHSSARRASRPGRRACLLPRFVGRSRKSDGCRVARRSPSVAQKTVSRK